MKEMNKITDVKKHNELLSKFKSKYLKMGFTIEHAETLSLFEMYIPGFQAPNFTK